MIKAIFKLALAAATAWLAAQCALAFLPGAFAQAPARIAKGTRLISARHAILPDAAPALDGLLLLTGATFANESASGLPSCPDTLAGVTVWIGDEPQPLRYVSPDSVLVVPRRLTSWLIVRGFDGRIYYAPVRMAVVSPAIILAGSATNESETLTPLAMWRFGKYPPEILSPYGVPSSRDGYPTVILIQGTGWRHASDVRATLGGVACPVLYAGSSNIFPGQDSLAIELPLALTQRGPLDLVVEAAGQRSNVARVWVRD